ncbi:MAG: cytochrome c3 family protein [Desulfobacterales bacterium]
MRIQLRIFAFIIGILLAGTVGWQASMAQEAEYILAHDDVFGSLRRPEVDFSHAKHAESLENKGCGVCHHTPDDQNGQLVYIEGDERSCKECHDLRKEDNIPALREAFHGNCTNCHRQQIKTDNLKSGPTTCGGCHKKG